MCGILGAFSADPNHLPSKEVFANALDTLAKRGPDAAGIESFPNLFLGHRRLSIIDTSEGANQPFQDESDRYTLVFNGEIYNYSELKQNLGSKYNFITGSDTEVLLYHLIENGAEGINELNGFFAFALWDNLNNTLLIARDRYGIKPLYIYKQDGKIFFASEMKALLGLGINKKINDVALYRYLQYNYLPGNECMLQGVNKLKPAHFIKIEDGKLTERRYFVSSDRKQRSLESENLSKVLDTLLRKSVERRMIADVPLGAFLSGGVDSSIITYLAKAQNKDLQSFSIGYKDEPLFDESSYAEQVAKHLGTKHHTFNLSNDVLLENMQEVLDYIDEPFADSSALAVYTLCKYTKNHITVALSGDGADEIFAGYNKHRAEYLVKYGGLKRQVARLGSPLWAALPKSRSSKYGNIIRQLDRFAKMCRYTETERYLFLARFMEQAEAQRLMNGSITKDGVEEWLYNEVHKDEINGFLDKDITMVLEGDMLVKVDRMSMANSLEVRVPFLDHELVEFARQLKQKHKIDANYQKKILRDTYYQHLPSEVFDRKKHGFEVPLLKWFRNELSSDINNKWLNEEQMADQGVFNIDEVRRIKKKLQSSDPGDVQYDIWKLIVFQNWYNKYFG